MPTYEYLCYECKKRFEKFQNITAEPIKKCPDCGGKVKKLIGPVGGIIFKGPGFYTTEYRSSEYKKKAKEESTSVGPKDSSTPKPCDSCKAASSCPANK